MVPGQNVFILLFHTYLRQPYAKSHVLFVPLRLHLGVACEKIKF